MKILFFNYEYPPIGGGASTATEAILKAWTKDADMEAHLITAGTGAGVERIHVGGKVWVHRVPIGKNMATLHSQSLRDIAVYSWKAWWFAYRFIQREQVKQRFDMTLAFFTVPCGLLAYGIQLRFAIPFVTSLRGADVPGFSEKYDRFYLFAAPLVRFLWRRSKAVIPNSVGIQALARKTSPHQEMHIIENGVDTALFAPASEPLASSPIVFLSTSRLTPRKGIDRLIEAFARAVQTSAVPLELRLIGEGEQKPALEARVKELGIDKRVQFLGRIDHSDLPRYYQSAHIFVLPSKNEGMSNSALEALASGLPLLVSGTGGMQELVTDGENGRFVDPDDTEGFARAMTELVADPKQLALYGTESRRRALLRSWDSVAESFKKVIEASL